MAKVSAKNAVVLVGGYNLSSHARSYEISAGQSVLEATGFGDGWKNYIPGPYKGEIAVDFYWDSAAGKTLTALKTLANKCVTILPEAYVAGGEAFMIESEQENIKPGGSVNDILGMGNVRFMTSGPDGGPLMGWVLYQNTITNTTTSASVLDPSNAVATARCAGVLHITTACAADTYVVKIQDSPDDAAWDDLVTFTLNGSAVGSEKVEVASGTVNKYRRVVATRTGGAGNSFGFTVGFWHAG